MDTSKKKLLTEYETELIRLRRWLHQHPELSMEETETSQFISEYLQEIGIPCRRTGSTGVIADLLAGDDLPVLAIRAEIDGLPIEEKTGLSFASCYPGRMHACGHDAITAVVLCLARVLAEHRKDLKYNIRFLFEPGEETGEGAHHLMAHQALENPRPEGIIVFHFGNQEARAMEIQQSISTAAIGGLHISIQGKSSHWSQRSEGIDAMAAAARLILEIQRINEELETSYPFVLGFGRMEAGKSGNIVAGEAKLAGSLRTFSTEDFSHVLSRLEEKIQETEAETGVQIQLEITRKIPPIINDAGLVKRGEEIGREIFGDKFYLGTTPFLVGDNAAFYMEQVPGMRVVFLAGKPGENSYPVHNSRFDLAESVMLDALRFLYRMCSRK